MMTPQDAEAGVGHPLSEVVARDAVDNYDALAQFTAYARAHR
jgi:hypothetical protein